MFPKHTSLHIEHNPHVEDGQDAATWLDEERRFFGASFPDEHLAQMIAADEVWIIRWVGELGTAGHAVFAHSWERALELANATSAEDASLADQRASVKPMQSTHFTLDLVIGQTSRRVTATVHQRPDRGLPLFELSGHEDLNIHSLGERHIATMIMQFLLANRVEEGATVHVGKITEGTYGNGARVEYADTKST